MSGEQIHSLTNDTNHHTSQSFIVCLPVHMHSCRLAYRIPDTNINLSGRYEQGRTQIQMSCVPDDSAPMLGPQGFVNGVGPGNLGISVNLNI